VKKIITTTHYTNKDENSCDKIKLKIKIM
ncbi:capsular biosynthesis protein, partial [Staphylococcus simulans]